MSCTAVGSGGASNHINHIKPSAVYDNNMLLTFWVTKGKRRFYKVAPQALTSINNSPTISESAALLHMVLFHGSRKNHLGMNHCNYVSSLISYILPNTIYKNKLHRFYPGYHDNKPEVIYLVMMTCITCLCWCIASKLFMPFFFVLFFLTICLFSHPSEQDVHPPAVTPLIRRSLKQVCLLL